MQILDTLELILKSKLKTIQTLWGNDISQQLTVSVKINISTSH